MPYNARIKEYGNGTLQLTFYGTDIRLKEDYCQSVSYLDKLNDDEYIAYNDSSDLDILSDNFLSVDYDFSDIPSDIVSAEYGQSKDPEFSLYVSMNRSKRMIYDYGRSNIWEWFFTLTFEHTSDFDASDYDLCKKKITQWFSNIRKRYCPDIKYLIVPERHKSGSWHFHSLVSNCSEISVDFTPGINNQKYRKDENGDLKLNKKGEPVLNKYFGQILRTSYPSGDIIYNIPRYRFGFSTATRIKDTSKAVSYICKYITKDLGDVTLGKRRYLPSNNLELPKKTFANIPPDELSTYLQKIEYVFGKDLSIQHVKKYHVNVPNYHNCITIFEFAPHREEVRE
jgi:hypothetical protein